MGMRKHHQHENEEGNEEVFSNCWYSGYDFEEVLTVFLLLACRRLLTLPATKPVFWKSACLKTEYFCIYHLSTSPGYPHQPTCNLISLCTHKIPYLGFKPTKPSVLDFMIDNVIWNIIFILKGNCVLYLFLQPRCDIGVKSSSICMTTNKNDIVLIH